jgi:hypothetical protein
LLHDSHDIPSAGHLGVKKTVAKQHLLKRDPSLNARLSPWLDLCDRSNIYVCALLISCSFPSLLIIALLLLRALFEGLFLVVRRLFWAMLIWGNIYPNSLIPQVVFPTGFITEDS